jgi:hypothetical protein
MGGFECVIEIAQVLGRPVMPAVGGALPQGREERMPFDAGLAQGDEAVEVARAEGVHHLVREAGQVRRADFRPRRSR